MAYKNYKFTKIFLGVNIFYKETLYTSLELLFMTYFQALSHVTTQSLQEIYHHDLLQNPIYMFFNNK